MLEKEANNLNSKTEAETSWNYNKVSSDISFHSF